MLLPLAIDNNGRREHFVFARATRSPVVQRVGARGDDALVVVVAAGARSSARNTGGGLVSSSAALAPGVRGGVERCRSSASGPGQRHRRRGERPVISAPGPRPAGGACAVDGDGELQHDGGNGEAQGGGACQPPPPHGRGTCARARFLSELGWLGGRGGGMELLCFSGEGGTPDKQP